MNLPTLLPAAVIVFVGAACQERSTVAYGDASSIIVAVPDTLWAAVEDRVHTALEPRIFAVRDERTFQLTQISPQAPEWSRLREWKQVLVIGQVDDPWVAPVVDAYENPLPDAPALIEATGVWARNQRATALLLPPGGGEPQILALLPELHDSLDARFRAYVQQRMYASGVEDGLRERLESEAGFSLLFPDIYDELAFDSTYVFRNHYMANDLGRTVLVTWRAGEPEGLGADAALEWRGTVAQEYYAPAQNTDREQIETRALDGFGARAFEVRGIWSNVPGEWPAAGPFISRVVVCPQQDRTYLLDAWLYGPGTDKYEYMLQLETILDSFECGGAEG